MAGFFARMFWGKPIRGLMDSAQMIHVPLASDICQGSADQVFGEPPTISPRTKNQKVEDQLARYVKHGLWVALQNAAETAAALGGTFLRATWDERINNGEAFISVVDADYALPEFLWGELIRVTFVWTVFTDYNVVWRHVEVHEYESKKRDSAVILHALYKGTSDNLGQESNLANHPATEDLPERIVMGNGLGVWYVPNLTPNRILRDDPLGAQLGRSDLEGSEPLMDALDRTYSSLMRDVRVGQARIMVPTSFLDDMGPGRGAEFNVDREVFVGLEMPPTGTEQKFDVVTWQPQIRVNEHLQVMQQIVEDVLRSAGWSTQTFGEDESGGSATATEVNSRDRRTANTRDRKIELWKPAIEAAILKLLELDRVSVGEDGIEVKFSESTSENGLALATTASMLKAAGAASTPTLVARVNPSWDADQIKAEVALINGETEVPDPEGNVRNNPPASGDNDEEADTDEEA